MKTLVLAVVILALVSLPLKMAHSRPLGERRTEPEGSPPVISHSFAAEKLSHGDIWKIYLEAHDADGDMRQFVCVLHQQGYGPYSSEYVMIRKRYREKMKGYLTFSSVAGGGLYLPEWSRLTLTVYIRDRGGNTSDKVVFPVVLSRGAKQGPPPPPFDAGRLERLGAIPIELIGRRRRD